MSSRDIYYVKLYHTYTCLWHDTLKLIYNSVIQVCGTVSILGAWVKTWNKRLLI